LQVMFETMFQVAFFSILIAFSAAFYCPEGWTHSGDYCYRISSERLYWYDAQEYCMHRGGYLAEIKSSAEQISVEQILNVDLYYWIGLSDLLSEGNFIWETSHTDLDYSNWDEGEPNDEFGDEDCVIIWLGYKWNDHYCGDDSHNSVPIHALCQTDLIFS